MDHNNQAVVLVVDDEPKMVGVVSYTLQASGFEVLVAYDGPRALNMIRKHRIDIIILDVMLPCDDGFVLFHKIRDITNIPILFLTAKSDHADVIKGLELGAEDYIGKPFRTRELVLRVKSILRRTRKIPALRTFVRGPLKIDFFYQKVTMNDQTVDLTQLEYRLLSYLARNEGRVIGWRELVQKVWDLDVWESGSDVVKVGIYRLRQKIEPIPKKPKFIRTVRFSGYKFLSKKNGLPKVTKL